MNNSAKKLYKLWSGSNYKEVGNVNNFWNDIVQELLGKKVTDDPKDTNSNNIYIDYEKTVDTMNKRSNNSIDAYIPSTKVLIEQKAPYKDLTTKEKQSSGKYFSPYEQAKNYDNHLRRSEKSKWIITCNFHQIWVYDMDKSGTRPKPDKISLRSLCDHPYQLHFLVDSSQQDIKREKRLSVQACKIINKIYESLLSQYQKPTSLDLQNINKICVRIVFCLYADDSGIFGAPQMFHNYMFHVPSDIWNVILKRVFHVLDLNDEERNKRALGAKIRKFPYVNGGMFKDKPKDHFEIPNLNTNTIQLILNAGNQFDWSTISPTIFGALFESTLNLRERKANGMHYTSIPNIRKVIRPLFLETLNHELNHIEMKYTDSKILCNHLKKFQDKLASLKFIDPACGSGNFLTETYLCLRNLENKVIKLRINISRCNTNNLIEVSIRQFYGIEINDFAVSVAKTAMWIAESQMVKNTQKIINQNINFLPLTSNPNIIEANALQIHWSNLVSPKDINYIISNPPFAGDKKDKQQKQDMRTVMTGFKAIGKLDYVSAWYKKSADLMKINPKIHAALVSTNNITNGIQIGLLWKPLINNYDIHINFAYRRFKWQNSAKKQAIVYCVIIGFSKQNNHNKFIVNEFNEKHNVNHICPYLYELPNIIVTSRNKPLNKNIPKMTSGSKPTDKGYLSKYSNLDKQDICADYPQAKKLFKRFIGANEYIKNKIRWCLWLRNVNPKDWLNIPPIHKAVNKVHIYRAKSRDKATRKSSNTPFLFQAIRQPNTDYLLIPRHTSKNRDYIPIGYINKDIIVDDSSLYIPNANYYIFGVLESRLHTIWVSLVSGRFGPSFRYSAKITYNNFPWPTKITNKRRQAISKTAKGILYERTYYRDTPMFDLYKREAMPLNLRRAHYKNDKEVFKAYGLTTKSSKQEIRLTLLKMYLKQSKS